MSGRQTRPRVRPPRTGRERGAGRRARRPRPEDPHLEGPPPQNALAVINVGFMVSATGRDGQPPPGPAPTGAGAVEGPRDDMRPPPPSVPGEAPDDPVRGFLDATLRPLERAAREHNADLTQVLPSADQVDAAAASGSLYSPESTAVIELLSAGYGRYNMPFPELPPEAEEPPPPVTAPTEAAAGTTAQDILRAYFTVAVDRVRREAAAKGTDAEALVPAADDVEAAIRSGAMDSEPSGASSTPSARYASWGCPSSSPGPCWATMPLGSERAAGGARAPRGEGSPPRAGRSRSRWCRGRLAVRRCLVGRPPR